MSVTIAEIQATVARHYGIDAAEMTSCRSGRSCAQPRQIAMYIARRLTPRSLPVIGRHFGDRDHSTVLHAIRRVEALRIADEDTDFAIADLTRQIRARHEHTIQAELIGWMA